MNWLESAETLSAHCDPEREARRRLRQQIPTFDAPCDAKKWSKEIPKRRQQALAEVYFKGIPDEFLDAPLKVEWGEVLRPADNYVIRKVRYEAIPNYWIPALLYEPCGDEGPIPAVLNPNGHHAGGKACDYKQIRCANLAHRGMLALNFEFIGMGELSCDRHHNRLAFLNLTGFAGVGLFYLAMKKGLDLLLQHPRTDPQRVAMTGLSGGGWQTIVLAALDPRITVSIPVAGYTSIRARIGCDNDRGDLEQMPPDQAITLDYQEMTAMLCPRPALLILNERDDCCFQTRRTKPIIYDAVKPVYDAFGGAEQFKTHNNKVPGTHNYDEDNRSQLYRFLNTHFGSAGSESDCHDLGELYTEHELNVGLPVDQQSIPGLASARARQLTAARKPAVTATERAQRRQQIKTCLRLTDDQARFRRRQDFSTKTFCQEAVVGRLGAWTIPMLYRAPTTVPAKEACLHIADQGFTTLAGIAWDDECASARIEPLGVGKRALKTTTALLLESAGDRLLGIQVAQILAASHYLSRRSRCSRIQLRAAGPVCSTAALIAAALHPERFAELVTVSELARLEDLFYWDGGYEAWPSLFCFGLLEVADCPDFVALLEDVVYHTPGRCVPPRRG